MPNTELVKILGLQANDEGGGYHSISFHNGTALVAYVAIPKDHPLVGKGYDDLEDYGPEVNGGLTFARDNIFGWDYMHAYNSGTPEGDIAAALAWFRERDPNNLLQA